MTPPQISVVIPTRNRRALLARTLRSVLWQRSVRLHVIVVDEASSDGTGEYVAALEDPRIRLIRNSTALGVAAARNVGLTAATSPWVAFLDDDDLWAPQKLSAQIEALAADPEAKWSCVGAVTVNPDLQVQLATRAPRERDASLSLLRRNCIPGGGSGVVASTELAQQVGGFDSELRNFADWDMWLRLSLRSPVAAVDRPLVAYVRHRNSLSHDTSDVEREVDHIEGKYAALRAERGVTEYGAFQMRWIAQMHVRSGHRVESARRFCNLARHHGDRWALGRAAAYGVWPGFIRLNDLNAGRKVPANWRSGAEAWLELLRVSPAGGSETARRQPTQGAGRALDAAARRASASSPAKDDAWDRLGKDG